MRGGGAERCEGLSHPRQIAAFRLLATRVAHKLNVVSRFENNGVYAGVVHGAGDPLLPTGTIVGGEGVSVRSVTFASN